MSAVWRAPLITNWEMHSSHNLLNSLAFLGLAMSRADFGRAILGAKSVLEVGCGTGELSAMMAIAARDATILGTDCSEDMLARAERFACGRVRFLRWDATKPFMPSSRFSLGVTSHMLEHFSMPETVLNHMLETCGMVIAIVPHKQVGLDKYVEEGGLGHVFSFEAAWFERYAVKASLHFGSHAWPGDQLAVLIRGRCAADGGATGD